MSQLTHEKEEGWLRAAVSRNGDAIRSKLGPYVISLEPSDKVLNGSLISVQVSFL